MSSKRVIHQEYLQMWLNGEELERKLLNCEWNEFDGVGMTLDSFDDENYEFRKKPKLVKVDIEKFKDLCLDANFRSVGYEGILEWLSGCIVEE